MKRLYIILIVIVASCGKDSEEIYSCNDLTFTLSELEYADCGGSNGTLTVNAEGGKEPYLYRLNGGSNQSSNYFEDLKSQYYSIYVEDSNGCIDSVRTFLGSIEAVRAIALTEPSGCGSQNGRIKVIAKNGKLPYRYQLGENAEYTYDDTFSDLGSGVYSVWVKDDRDCFLGIYPVVLSGVSLDEAMLVLDANCSTSGCHDSSISPDLTSNQVVLNSSQQIIEIIDQDHHNVSLSAEELQLIMCWAKDIELENQ